MVRLNKSPAHDSDWLKVPIYANNLPAEPAGPCNKIPLLFRHVFLNGHKL